MAATLLVAACGGGSAGDDSGDRQSDEDSRLAFAACLRKAGVQVNDPTGRRGMDIRVPDGISRARMATIERDCARKTGREPRGGGKEPSPREKAEFLDQALQFARCMRAHGVPMADPVQDGRGIRIKINGSKADPNSPVFRRAQRACDAFNLKGGGRAGKSGGSK